MGKEVRGCRGWKGRFRSKTSRVRADLAAFERRTVVDGRCPRCRPRAVGREAQEVLDGPDGERRLRARPRTPSGRRIGVGRCCGRRTRRAAERGEGYGSLGLNAQHARRR